MKTAGDVPQEVREYSLELEEFEKLVDRDTYTNERKAQMYTCLAHDWYEMDMEEVGNRLLLKADAISPGYFAGAVIKHQEEDPTFDYVVKQLTSKLASLLTESLRNK